MTFSGDEVQREIGHTASYDASGDMTCRAPTSSQTCSGGSTRRQLAYDNEGRLVSWTGGSGSTCVAVAPEDHTALNSTELGISSAYWDDDLA
jgi:hypothetical protein